MRRTRRSARCEACRSGGRAWPRPGSGRASGFWERSGGMGRERPSGWGPCRSPCWYCASGALRAERRVGRTEPERRQSGGRAEAELSQSRARAEPEQSQSCRSAGSGGSYSSCRPLRYPNTRSSPGPSQRAGRHGTRWCIARVRGGRAAHLVSVPLAAERAVISAELMGTGCGMAMSSPLRL